MKLRKLALVAGLILALAGCSGQAEGEPDNNTGKLPVVATFSVLGDMVQAIGGDLVSVHSIVPLGVDPHEYAPLPLDLQKTADASLILWNGLNMELGGGWFEDLLEVSGNSLDAANVVEAARRVTPLYLTDDSPGATEGAETAVNPHAFLDPNVGILYAQEIADGLSKADPEHAEQYQQNVDHYVAQLQELDQLYRDRINQIPQSHRVLVTSENAYQYLAQQYGLTPGYVWAIDTDEQGTPEQIKSLVSLIRKSQVPALFVESNKDPRPMEAISKETGVPIYGTLFSDELGKPGKDGGTYLKMLRFNIDQISAGLTP